MQNFDCHRQKIIVALFLLWLALTGGYAGWGHPVILFINFLLWLGLMVWLCVCAPRIDALGWAIVGLMAAILLSAGLTGRWYAGLTQAAVLSGYLAIYFLARQWPDEIIHRGAFLGLVIFMVLGTVIWDDPNIRAFSLVGLAWLAWPIGGWGMLLVVALFNLAYLGGLGCYLALIAGAVVIVWQRPGLRLVTVGGIAPILLFDWWLSGDVAYAVRFRFWADALRLFSISPLWGAGPGTYRSLFYWHSHNLILTTAAELGLLGLLGLMGFVWIIWKRWETLPIWAAALTIAFAVWSLVDEPTRFWGPGAMLMIAWSRGGRG